MQITEVRITMPPRRRPDDRLLCYARVTFDREFVVSDLRLVSLDSGIILSMPSRKYTDLCPKCSRRCWLRDTYCSGCGMELGPERGPVGPDGKRKLWQDVAYPVVQELRDRMTAAVLAVYRQAVEVVGMERVGPTGSLVNDA